MDGDISKKVKAMAARQRWEYILSYYWHYLLLVAAAAGLVSLLGYHLFLAGGKPKFTCVLVNQQADGGRDRLIREQLADLWGVGIDEVVIDSSFQFSYDDIRLEGVNESSYEKFFLKWSMGELDAVMMPESFYRHCVGMGGVFSPPEEMTGQWFIDDGEPAGIIAAGTKLAPYLYEQADDGAVIVFPAAGEHQELAVRFIEFLKQ